MFRHLTRGEDKGMGGLVGDQAGIAVVGSGYVGTVVAACLASVGHRVFGVEIDPERLERLRLGDVPFYEPGLNDVVREAVDSGRHGKHR